MNTPSSIGVTPGFQEISLHPGDTYHGVFNVVNPDPDAANLVNFQVYISPFFVLGDDYTISFETQNDFTKMANWVSIDQPRGVVKGKDMIEIPFTIHVPTDVPGGGQYAAFIIRAITPNTQTSESDFSLNINHQVASILYASVDGETHQDGKVINNTIDMFEFDSPVSGSVSIVNTGNIHFDAVYTFKVSSLFSDEELYSTETSPKNNIVLPQTTLTSFNTWDDTPNLGIFRVSQTVTFLQDTFTTEKTVFVCPLWFLIIWIIFLVSGLIWLFVSIRHRKNTTKRAKTWNGSSISR